MRWDFVAIVIFIGLVLSGVYFYDAIMQKSQYDSYSNNISAPSVSGQFYKNMRYPDRVITYSLSPDCNFKKQDDITGAFAALEKGTVLKFVKQDEGEIVFYCTQLQAAPDETGHFIAGEGGPSKIIDAGRFSVILSGKISLYRPEKCDSPKVAIHEILHALGFDHNSNKKSILYPITECDQEIDQYIFDNLNELYTIDSKSDIVINSASAVKDGPYLNFALNISNQGLKESKGSELIVSADDKQIDTFNVGKLNIGITSSIKVNNVPLIGNPKRIIFQVNTDESELSKENNRAELTLA